MVVATDRLVEVNPVLAGVKWVSIRGVLWSLPIRCMGIHENGSHSYSQKDNMPDTGMQYDYLSTLSNLHHTKIQMANPPEFFCLGSPAASNVPFPNLLNACAVLCPGATYVTLWPRSRINSTVALSYAYSKLTTFGTS